MKTRTIAILAASAVLLVGGMFVVAQRVMQKGMYGRGHGAMMMFRQLNLTDDQKAKVKEIFEANKGTAQPLMEQLKANHEKIAALNGSDDAQLQTLAKQQGDLLAQMIVAREHVKSQVFAILTDEQKAKAAQVKDQMKQRFQDRMKTWGQKGDAAKGSEDEE
jgi:protein CpxP